MIKTLLHQYLLHLGLENFFSHPSLISRNVPNYFSFIFQIWGPPLHCTSDRPCQLIIFPIEKSLHEFFFSNFSGARIFFFCFPCSIFIFAFAPPPHPHHFSNGPPLSKVYAKEEPTWQERKVGVFCFLMCCRQSPFPLVRPGS